MTNSRRSAARARRSVLAALTVRACTADQLQRRLPRVPRVVELLDTMEQDGEVHSQRRRQYPGGPLVPVWYAGKGGV